MHYSSLLVAGALVALLALPVQSTHAAEPASSSAKSLSSILTSAANERPGTIVEAELDDGLWEVKTCNNTGCMKLYFDPMSGSLRSSKPTGHKEVPAGNTASALSVTQRIEASGLGQIREIEFEHGHWEAKLRIAPQSATTSH